MRNSGKAWPALACAAAGLAAWAATAWHGEGTKAPLAPGSSAPPSPSAAAVPADQDLVALTADSRSVIDEGVAAQAANAKLALNAKAIEAAPAFSPAASGLVRDRAETCLAQAIYYEAGFEGEGGRRAVAQVVLNRVRHPAFPHSVCGVVFQQSAGTCQFTFACDGAMNRAPVPALWARSRREAREALSGRVERAVGMATHYHADYVYPAWAPQLDKIAVIGRHIFYRWPRGWGLRKAFTARYSGIEDQALLAEEVEQLDLHRLPDGRVSGTFAAPQGGGEVAPRRSGNDGGYVDPVKGWRPSISDVESETAAKASPQPPR